MRTRLGIVLGGTVLTLAAMLTAGAGNAAAEPTPAPTLTCPPALPVSGTVTAATAESLTISYVMLLSPPCGYDPPIVVTLFARLEDAQQWQNPVAEATSGPERNGTVTVGGLTPGTAYWFRFSAGDQRDPYFTGSGRTAPRAACTAAMAIDSAWAGGFVATVTVRNVGDEPLGSWQVRWRWPAGESIQALWNGVADNGGDGVTIRNAPYNGTLAPGGSATFGLLAAAGAPPAGLALTCDR